MSIVDDSFPLKSLRTTQIIASAIILGVVAFFVIALVFALDAGNLQMGMQNGEPPMVSLIAIALLVMNGPILFIFPTVLARAAVKRIAGETPQADSDKAKLLAVRQTITIVTLAMLEAAGLTGCVALLVERNLLALIPVGSAIGLMLVNFPTEQGVRNWLGRHLEILADQRRSI